MGKKKDEATPTDPKRAQDPTTPEPSVESRRRFLKGGLLWGVGLGAGAKLALGCTQPEAHAPEATPSPCPACECPPPPPAAEAVVAKPATAESSALRAVRFNPWPITTPAPVYYTRITEGQPLSLWAEKTDALFKRLDPQSVIAKNDLVAVKQHFGEAGNEGYIRPEITRKVIDEIKRLGGKPMLVETNTLYAGSRTNTHDHLLTAYDHGFTLEKVGAPVAILDGLAGQIQQGVAIPGKHFSVAFVASDVLFYQGLVVLSHVKGHGLSGFGGALKNLAMGLSSRAGKLAQHSDFTPFIDGEKCTHCGDCPVWCPPGSLHMRNERLQFDETTCIGCGQCLTVCRYGAIQNQSPRTEANAFMEKMAEYALAAAAHFQGKALYVNLVNHVSKRCDCARGDNPVMAPDVGIFASRDPVAVDQASLDISRTVWGKDPFHQLYPGVDGEVTIQHAAKLGLGTTQYTLIEV